MIADAIFDRLRAPVVQLDKLTLAPWSEILR